MNREIHVRICEGLRGKFPWSTRRTGFADPKMVVIFKDIYNPT